MSLKNAKYLLGVFSLTALIIAAIGRNTIVSTVLTLICVFASLAILYPNLAKLSNVSEDNPKVKTLKSVTIFTIIFFGIIVLLVVVIGQLEKRGMLAELSNSMSEEQINTASKAFMALVLAVPVLFFGNAAPQIPFNRYIGLRLPWTVRDEGTWIVAHRVLGYISIPIAILVFVNVPTDMLLDTYVKFWWLGAVLLWIGIPGLISGVFYYKKWNGKLAIQLDVHALRELGKHFGIFLLLLFRYFMPLHAAVPFLSVPQRFLQTFHCIEGLELLSPLFSHHHIRPDDLQSSRCALSE